MRRVTLLLLAWLVLAGTAGAQPADYTRREDVIYGRKLGLALTMDVFTPAKARGVGVIFVVSGGWFSAHEAINPGAYTELLRRGYTVFAVVHGSQPRYTIPEVLQDMHRAVRYIRFHARDFGVDPDRLGITGGSAGGHLSLMQGVAPDAGDPKAKDPIDSVSSRVQAVACFFPPTDFLNYGQDGVDAVGRNVLKDFAAPFDFQEFSTWTRRFERITAEARIREIARAISPVYHVAAGAPPTLIIHGDADTLVPIQQSRLFVQKMKDAGCTAELVTKPGLGHGWPTLADDMKTIADWFDRHLTARQGAAGR